jgi:transglutaminase-like putative cysteine protease
MKKLHLSLIINVILLAAVIYLAIDFNKCEKPDKSQSYLEETFYCDFNNPEFSDLNFTRENDTQTALDIFHYVRDSIPMWYDDLNTKASDVHKEGNGACWSKAVLMTALLRKHGIPARIVKSALDQEAFRLVVGDQVDQSPSPFYHCFVQVKLDGKWIYADPTIDQASWDHFFADADVKYGIDWDGKTDHLLYVGYILEPIEVIENIDLEYGTTIGN